jgi:thiol-disulfide isomerase/thioredoxin
MKTFSLLASTLGILLATTAPGSAQDDILGRSAHNFTLKDVNGRDVSLSKFKGKAVVLDFWAVWCGPCVRSLPLLQSFADKYRSQGLEVIGLHVDDRMPPAAEIKEYLSDRAVQYTNVLSTVRVDEEYLIMAMPTTYFVDRQGKLVGRHVGFNPSSSPEKLEQEIKALLAKR